MRSLAKEMKNLKILAGPPSLVGWGASEGLPNAIIEQHPERILLVTDPVLIQLSAFQLLFKQLQNTGVFFELYSDIMPEPTLEAGQKLVDFARKGRYDMVIGVGGGSALDLAKLAAVFVGNEGPLHEYLNLSGQKRVQHKGIFKILVPTTSGTGSEVTDIAVLSLGDTKDVISHPYLQADLAVVDPKLTLTVPPKVTAATGADALTHAIEAYLSVNSNPYSEALALEAIRLMVHALPNAVQRGEDEEMRSDMSYGSYLAALSFYNAGVGAVHALAYPLGGEFHLAHGDSNAVMLPYVLEYIRPACADKLSNILRIMQGKTPLSEAGPGTQTQAIECVRRLKVLIREIGIPTTLKDFGIPESALGLLASQGNMQTRLLARCPIALDEQAIFEIYSNAYFGKSDLDH